MISAVRDSEMLKRPIVKLLIIVIVLCSALIFYKIVLDDPVAADSGPQPIMVTDYNP